MRRLITTLALTLGLGLTPMATAEAATYTQNRGIAAEPLAARCLDGKSVTVIRTRLVNNTRHHRRFHVYVQRSGEPMFDGPAYGYDWEPGWSTAEGWYTDLSMRTRHVMRLRVRAGREVTYAVVFRGEVLFSGTQQGVCL